MERLRSGAFLLAVVGACSIGASCEPSIGGPGGPPGRLLFPDAGELPGLPDASIFDDGAMRANGGCQPDMLEPDDSFATRQVADLGSLFPNPMDEVSFPGLTVPTPTDVDWYRVPLTDQPGSTAGIDLAVTMLNDHVGPGAVYDLSLWYECGGSSTTEADCVAGDDETPLPTAVTGGTIVVTSPGCRSSSMASSPQMQVRMQVQCGTGSGSGTAWIRVQPERWGGACDAYDLQANACRLGPEEPADSPADAYELTPPDPVPSPWMATRGWFDTSDDQDWYRVHLTDPSLTDVTATLSPSPAVVTRLEMVYACDSGTGTVSCDAADTAITEDLGDGAAPQPGCHASGMEHLHTAPSCGADASGWLYVHVSDGDPDVSCGYYDLSLAFASGGA